MSTSSQGRSSVKNTYPQNLTWQPLDRSMLWNKAWNPIRTLLFIALSLPHLCLPQKKGTSSYSLWQALTLRATQIFPSQEPHATPTLKPLANTPWANLPPGKSVIMPYTSPPIKTISQTTFYISRETITRALTIQALGTDQPALLRMEANKKLGLLTLNANFTWKPPRFPTCTLRTTRTQLLAHSPVPLDTSTDKWPKPGTLSMKFISQHCTLLF